MLFLLIIFSVEKKKRKNYIDEKQKRWRFQKFSDPGSLTVGLKTNQDFFLDISSIPLQLSSIMNLRINLVEFRFFQGESTMPLFRSPFFVLQQSFIAFFIEIKHSFTFLVSFVTTRLTREFATLKG